MMMLFLLFFLSVACPLFSETLNERKKNTSNSGVGLNCWFNRNELFLT